MSTMGVGLGFCIDLWDFSLLPVNQAGKCRGSPGLAQEGWGNEGGSGPWARGVGGTLSPDGVKGSCP